MIAKIVITGAPGSGKTKVLDRLKVDSGFSHFVFFDELARQLLSQNPELRMNRHELHQRIYTMQVNREDALRGQSFITDRGTVDAFAFHPGSLRFVGTTVEREYLRYTAVVQLGSSARLGAEYYKTDEVRTESASDALLIEGALRIMWKDHPQYHFVEPAPDWDEKFRVCCDLLLRLSDESIVSYARKSDD